MTTAVSAMKALPWMVGDLPWCGRSKAVMDFPG
jgi:hypothetical protein